MLRAPMKKKKKYSSRIFWFGDFYLWINLLDIYIIWRSDTATHTRRYYIATWCNNTSLHRINTPYTATRRGPQQADITRIIIYSPLKKTLIYRYHFFLLPNIILQVIFHYKLYTKMTTKMQLCRIIYYSLAAPHVLSGIFAHHQEHLNCITASGITHVCRWQ